MVKDLWPVMIVLDLQLDAETGRDVDEETRKAVRRLFTWDTSYAVVLAETSSRELKEMLERDLGWAPETVIAVGDYDRVEDALEQMRRAPRCTKMASPTPGSSPRPWACARSACSPRRRTSKRGSRSPRLVSAHIREQLEAIGSEKTLESESPELARYGS